MAAIADNMRAGEITIPVYFLLRDATMALDLIGPAEVLRYANRIAGREGRPNFFDVRYISAADNISTSIGLGLTGFGPLPDSLPADAILVLNGCTGSDDDFSSIADQRAVSWLHTHWGASHKLLCICTGALLAGYAGLLDDRQCTTHHSHCDDLRRIAPRAHVLENRIFVEDRNVYTSAGVTTGIDLALHVVAQICGHARSASIARSLVVYMRRAGSDPQLSPWLACRNHLHPAIHRVQDAVIGNPANDWDLQQLAEIACTSERHLTRLFREHTGSSLVDYIQRIRVALVRELLTQSKLDMEQVAQQAGFNSTRQLRRVWSKFESLPPSRQRQTNS
ncbi:Transcriptional regulator GlxA family, contains an amidase domain and an AraC-type DNA-binding HTH domain [Collimonas sp. OK307]|uniref:GlxA family transcriptional regulator n=1 Tax=Collimonas sp. OK307 TaxID=1801620 RepID=UPI0008F19C3B|nr:helix-turn-helix domain-containing protein [Collimonas sp. OK307]SFI13857.1 Transcriptional regulator GlxA family, contains an amidase domain and an AraC-type DNA-binding HTH domain [Collimonas sp. OK307]